MERGIGAGDGLGGAWNEWLSIHSAGPSRAAIFGNALNQGLFGVDYFKEILMVQINIQLPEDIKSIAEERAARGGYRNVDTYVESLIRADVEEEFSPPEHLHIHSQTHLEELLQEAHAGGTVELTKADWEEKRRRLVEKHAALKAT